MGRAIAKVNGTTIAVTDKWETVEGNVYVPSSRPTTKHNLTNGSVSPRFYFGQVDLFRLYLDHQVPLEGNFFLLQYQRQWKHLERCGVVLPRA